MADYIPVGARGFHTLPPMLASMSRVSLLYETFGRVVRGQLHHCPRMALWKLSLMRTLS